MEDVSRAYGAVLVDPIASMFFNLIAFLFLAALFLAIIPKWRKNTYFSRYVALGPSLFTTLGVLGTFVGIFIGLLNFDVANIDASVPSLLAGMKIAFATSIIGMAAAIIFKLVLVFIPQTERVAEVTPEAIYGVLAEIRDDAKRHAETEQSALQQLRSAISSEGDGSLLTQLQKMRTALQDGHDALRADFRTFAVTMTENNSKALVEALEAVIRDFNAQINEQFGQNFKQLNKAVGALLIWQENYRHHVERLEDQFKLASSGIEKSEAAITLIAKNTSTIPASMRDLDLIMRGLERQTDNLESHLEAVANLRDKALTAFPVIEDNIKKLTEGFKDTADRLVTSTRQSVELSEHNTREATRKVGEAWDKTQEGINQQFIAFDKQMQEELKRALELMGSKLASLSEKFVSDYEPLTLRLREVMNMARV